MTEAFPVRRIGVGRWWRPVYLDEQIKVCNCAGCGRVLASEANRALIRGLALGLRREWDLEVVGELRWLDGRPYCPGCRRERCHSELVAWYERRLRPPQQART